MWGKQKKLSLSEKLESVLQNSDKLMEESSWKTISYSHQKLKLENSWRRRFIFCYCFKKIFFKTKKIRIFWSKCNSPFCFSLSLIRKTIILIKDSLLNLSYTARGVGRGEQGERFPRNGKIVERKWCYLREVYNFGGGRNPRNILRNFIKTQIFIENLSNKISNFPWKISKSSSF